MPRITHEEFTKTLVERFGDNPAQWAFVCPSCGDVATGQDFKDALAKHPRTARSGEPLTASSILGQECIGRTLGALSTSADDWARRRQAGEVRGCDWCAFGLFRGPLIVEVDGRDIASFNIAEAVTAP